MSFNPNNPYYTRSQAKGVSNLLCGVQRMNAMTPEEGQALSSYVATLPNRQQQAGPGIGGLTNNTVTVITMPDGRRYGGNFPVFTSYAKNSGSGSGSGK